MRVVVQDRNYYWYHRRQYMGQIELNCVFMLNWIVWNNTVLTLNSVNKNLYLYKLKCLNFNQNDLIRRWMIQKGLIRCKTKQPMNFMFHSFFLVLWQCLSSWLSFRFSWFLPCGSPRLQKLSLRGGFFFFVLFYHYLFISYLSYNFLIIQIYDADFTIKGNMNKQALKNNNHIGKELIWSQTCLFYGWFRYRKIKIKL